MDDDFITRREHEEFRLNIDNENNRQNHRLKELEEGSKQIYAIVTSVEKLALNMENMLKELASQGNRLKTLEDRDGEKWRQWVGFLGSAVIGSLVGYFYKQLGM